MFAIEIHREEKPARTAEHGIHAHHKRHPAPILAGEMPAHGIIRHRQPSLMRAIAALDSRLLSHPAPPFISAQDAATKGEIVKLASTLKDKEKDALEKALNGK